MAVYVIIKNIAGKEKFIQDNRETQEKHGWWSSTMQFSQLEVFRNERQEKT